MSPPLVMLVVLAVAYVIAFTRKGSVKMAITSSRREVRSAADPATVAERIKALGAPYSVDDSDGLVIVLSSPVTFFSWGFFYPVVIHPDGSGSRIIVGVKSKVFQLGWVVRRAHANCVEAIEQALSIPTARVA